MFFQNSVPDPNMGIYSENVFGRDGEVEVVGDAFFSQTWFFGYYLSRFSGAPESGFLDYTGQSYILPSGFNTGSAYSGWIFHLDLGWLYISIPVNFNNVKKNMWIFKATISSEDNIGWLYFNRYFCIKDWRLGEDGLDFNTLDQTDSNYWILEILNYSSHDGANMTQGQGILTLSDYGVSSYEYALLKPCKISGEDVNGLRLYYKTPSSVNYKVLI